MKETVIANNQNSTHPKLRTLFVLISLNLLIMILTWAILGLNAQMRIIVTLVTQILFISAAIIWFLVFSGYSGKTRKIGLVLLFVAGGSLIACLEIRDFSGDMLPILAWRWAPDDRALELEMPIATVVPLQSQGADFPRFLGPDGNAMIPDTHLATDWKNNPPKELWRKKIGAGWSGFVVFGGLAITQEQRGEEEMVTCYSLKDGSLVWSHSDQIRFSSGLGGDGPRATPTIQNGQVFALGATGLLTCLDLTTGSQIWSRDLKNEHQGRIPDWGFSSSPLVTGRLVIVAIGGPVDRMLVAHDRLNGDFVWGSGSDAVGYSSPQIRVLAGQPQVLILNANSVSAHNPIDGSILWQEPWGKGSPNAVNPLVIDETHLLVSSGYGVGSALFEITGASGKQQVRRVYESSRLKAKFANFVKKGDAVFGLDDGVMTCIDLSNGERLWKAGRYGHGQLLLVGDQILLQSEAGILFLLSADPHENRELGSVQVLGEKSWNSPALAGNLLLMRNHVEAVCLELPLLQ